MQVIRLKADYAKAYREFMLAAYTQHPQAFTSTAKERAELPLKWWQNRLSQQPDASQWVFATLKDDQLTGVAGLAFSNRHKIRHKAQVFGVYVDPQQRGSGLGRLLMQHIIDTAKQQPFLSILQLSVSETNITALQLYQQLGFQIFATEPLAFKINNQHFNKLHLWLQLRMV